MFKPLAFAFEAVVVHGNLTVIAANGSRHTFGDGSGPPVVMELKDKRLERQLAINPQLAVGEAYMDGRLVMHKGEIYDLLDLVLSNAVRNPLPSWTRLVDKLRYVTRRIAQFNPERRSRRNVAHHYDIDGSIYDLFLDKNRQYSCAYFRSPNASLDDAQEAKLDLIAAKLALFDGARVLDIGSGWGGLAVHLAKRAHATVDGVTLSIEQLKGAEDRARSHGLDSAVHFEIKDYRAVEGRYDRVVSVGMFEHVGVNHYRAFFNKLNDLLTDDGVALIHFIGRSDVPTVTNPFIAKYIFPGGYIPALSEVMPAIERSGLGVTDIEVLRLHYAETLRRWRQRFKANWMKAAAIRDERFCRMWEFYLAGSEAAFRYQNLVVFQIQLAKRPDALPLTRDYLMPDLQSAGSLSNSAGRRSPMPMAGE